MGSPSQRQILSDQTQSRKDFHDEISSQIA
jgi:hypothetical protein